MAAPEFSEFTYGYVLTDTLVRVVLPGLKRAPFFPSLIAEGSTGGGYDVQIPAFPLPLFLQFKIPQVITRRSSLTPTGYWPPYYRLQLRTKKPDQHSLLLELERREPLVFYVAPLFHTTADLDRHFVRKTAHAQSVFISPSAIGKLDSASHHVAYQPGAATYWLHSEPHPLDGHITGVSLGQRIAHVGSSFARRASRDVMRAVWGLLVELPGISQSHDLEADIYQFPDDLREQARRVAYLAQVRLGLTFALLDAES
jgi:hypothetical protein